MSDLEKEKLNLEIQRLKQEVGAMGRWRSMLPFLTALVAIGSLWIGAWKFVSESELNRQLRAQEQELRIKELIRSNLQELLAFPENEQQTASKARFLLRDLHALLEYVDRRHLDPDEEALTDTLNILASLIRDDCNFDNRRDVQLEIALFDAWPEYADKLRTEPHRQTFLIYKYFQALRHLHDEAPEYFETLRYVPGSGFKVGDEGYTKEERYLHFASLTEGFLLHLDLMERGSEPWKAAVGQYKKALRNAALAESLFGRDVDVR